MPREFEAQEQVFNTPIEVRKIAGILGMATEVAALAANDKSGLGKRDEADQAAVDAMRKFLNGLHIRGVIEVGEGVKDKAPMLFIGEKVGMGNGPELSIALDPIDGTNATAGLKHGAISVLAASEKGGILRLPNDLHYVDKLITGPQARGLVNINTPVSENLKVIAISLNKDIPDLRIVVLDRPRNQNLILEIREAGAKVSLIDYGDLMPGVLTCIEGAGVHGVMGIGGAPEAVLTAAGVICLGGGIQVKPWTDKENVKESLKNQGFGLNRVLTERELVPGKSIVFSATGITHSNVIEEVRTFKGGARLDSLVLTASDGFSSIERRDFTLVTDTEKIEYRLK